MSKLFKFRNGFRAPAGVNPDRAAAELASIAERNEGKLTTGLVVSMSKNKHSALHKFFEWDNEVCGELYRKQQASQLIRAVIVIDDAGNTENVWHLTYKDQEKKRTSFYIQTEDLSGNDILIRNAKKLIIRHINGLEKELAELDRLQGSVNKDATDALQKLQKAIVSNTLS